MASTIPEVIVPSTLLAYTDQDFTTVATATLPNGDDSLLLTTAAGSGEQKAFQQRRLDSHLLRLAPGENSLSFWIRRRQSFANTANLTNSGGGGTGDPASLIMGVGDPVATDFDISVAPPPLAWGVSPSNISGIQFFMAGFSFNTFSIYASGIVTLNLDQWHLVVINIGAFTGTSDAPRGGPIAAYRDGQLISETTLVSSSSYYLRPSQVANFDDARFAIGDPTNSRRAVRGTLNGPVCDLAKIAFHDRHLTPTDQLAMLEAMRYGP